MNSNSVDAKEVLKLMNGLGYKNITAHELKEFTKDLKKLMKFDLKTRSPEESISTKYCPENVINVTIINEKSKQKENVKPSESNAEVQTIESQSQLTSGASSAASSKRRKLSKRMLLLPKHVKTRKTNVVYKKGTAEGVDDGVLVRNTPADLYQKYQNDWNKFKSLIPGDSTRRDVRERVRSKMKQKAEEPPKVYVYFADERQDQINRGI